MVIQSQEVHYLDLTTHKVYGWEPYKNLTKIKEMRRVLQKNIHLAPVYLSQVGSKYILQIPPFIGARPGGGHHRACAYWFERGNILMPYISAPSKHWKQKLIPIEEIAQNAEPLKDTMSFANFGTD